MDTVRIIHYSDILCIWAYIGQVRIDELIADFGDRVAVEYRLFPVFGHARGKFEKQWADRGGVAGYSRHVRHLAEQFEHVDLHPDVWTATAPRSSLPAHLYLCALRLAESEKRVAAGAFTGMARALRLAFFAEGADISQRGVLRGLLEREGLAVDELEAYIDSGAAYAELSEDIQLARDQAVSASPTFTFNDGRQRLTGNVGYRIIEANIRELLERPQAQHSWC